VEVSATAVRLEVSTAEEGSAMEDAAEGVSYLFLAGGIGVCWI
jgi:hypothetical protein